MGRKYFMMPREEWMEAVQKICRGQHARLYGTDYVPEWDSWKYFYEEGLSPQEAVNEDMLNGFYE